MSTENAPAETTAAPEKKKAKKRIRLPKWLQFKKFKTSEGVRRVLLRTAIAVADGKLEPHEIDGILEALQPEIRDYLVSAAAKIQARRAESTPTEDAS